MFLSVSATWCVSEKSRWTIPSQKQMMLTLHELAKRSETEPETKDTHCYLIRPLLPLKLTERFNTVLLTFLRDFGP